MDVEYVCVCAVLARERPTTRAETRIMRGGKDFDGQQSRPQGLCRNKKGRIRAHVML